MGVLSTGDEPAPRRRRFLLGAFGDPGHAFPMIALGRSLLRRGHEVSLQTWARWREHVEAEGMRFLAAPEYRVFPTGAEPLDFYEAVVQATRDTLPAVRELEPEVVVADILTLAPALAAELAGVPLATLIPHVYPDAGERLSGLLDRGTHAPRATRPQAMERGPDARWRRGSSGDGRS